MNDFTANHSAYIDADGKLITHNYEGTVTVRNYETSQINWRELKSISALFQTLSNIIVEVVNPATSEPAYSDYTRTLDVDNAIHRVTYKEGGITFKREYFMSYPDNIMVMRLTSDSKKERFHV